MKHRTSLHNTIDESVVRVNEIKLFWRLSCRVKELCEGVLDDAVDNELTELRDELDLIASMTDIQEMREKAQKRVDAIDLWLDRERARRQPIFFVDLTKKEAAG